MRVGGHERERLGAEVEVDAVHYGAQLVVGGGEYGLVDAVDQHVDVQHEVFTLVAEALHGGIAHRVGARDREVAAGPRDRDLPRGVVHVDRQGHFGELLERVEHQFGGGGDHAFAFDVLYRYGSDQSGLQIRGGDGQLSVFELHEEILQNGKRTFVADYLARGRQQRQQRRT